MVVNFVSSSFKKDFFIGKYLAKASEKNEIYSDIEQVARLRIKIFKEYPYLYDGNLEQEREYLKPYIESQDGILIIAKDGDKSIGAITGLPLRESMQELKDCYARESQNIDDMFYLGEVVLLKEYRGKGIGIFLYKALEEYLSSKKYSKIVFCAIAKEGNDQKKSKENYYKRLGFIRRFDLSLNVSYKKIGEEFETESKMNIWEKFINSC